MKNKKTTIKRHNFKVQNRAKLIWDPDAEIKLIQRGPQVAEILYKGQRRYFPNEQIEEED